MIGDSATVAMVGVRPAEQVREALDWLVLRSRDETIGPGGRGAAAAYRWALGHPCPPPTSPAAALRPVVAAADPARSGPPVDESRLMAEERAALAAARAEGRSTEEQDFAHGAAQALGWVLGYTHVRF
ncbi:hypothetical protein [Kitasatospora sp. KL5]|uniref:hypothetical protein n=1 Tax=Kitasatospora sp. KL5 TaxID=3425125 RepID=UPI003D6DAD21